MVRRSATRHDAWTRAEQAVRDVLPRSATVHRPPADANAGLVVGDQSLELKWAGEGSLADVRRLIASLRERPDIVVARRLSPGARKALSDAGVGWVDESGAAEIVLDSIIVSRTGRPKNLTERPKRWTPSVVAVAEAVLCGIEATVSATAAATGLSTGSCTNALRTLTDLGLLEAEARRGRDSGRRVVDASGMLDAYASAVDRTPARLSIQVGVAWQDPVAGLVEAGRKWDMARVGWAATGTAAASIIGPYLATVTSTDVYIDADTVLGLEAAATEIGLRPIDGGRLRLRPFPTAAVRRLADRVGGLRVAPWPRVYVDLRSSGVRGEDAAEHLREVIDAR